MDPKPCVDVVAPDAKTRSLASQLRLRLIGRARVRVWEDWPPSRVLKSTDVLVVIPGAEFAHNDSYLSSTIDGRTTWLVGIGSVDSIWLQVARLANVKVVVGEPNRIAETIDSVVIDILSRLRGPPTERILQLVVTSESSLIPLSRLAKAVCDNPWGVRHPRDLARQSGLSLLEIKAQCSMAGFSRVEHFITVVRLIGFEQLVAKEHLSVTVARQVVGIADRSNMRRHVRRALEHSPGSARLSRFSEGRA